MKRRRRRSILPTVIAVLAAINPPVPFNFNNTPPPRPLRKKNVYLKER